MRKLLIGCGIAVALVVAVLIAGGVFVTSWFKNQFPEATQLQQRRTEIVQKFGRPEVFVPPLDGVPATARLENFIALRETLVEHRDEAAARLGSFVRQTKRERAAGRGAISKMVDAIGMTQGGAAMVSGMLDYLGKRSRMMLAADMGEGEYDYLYVLTSFAYLRWDPLTAATDTSEVAHRDLGKQIVAQKFEMQSIFERQLANLQTALEKQATRTASEEAMLNALCIELPAAREKNALPFAAGLPPHLIAVLAPYEQRLRATLPRTRNGALLDVLQVSEEEGGVHFSWEGKHGEKQQVEFGK